MANYSQRYNASTQTTTAGAFKFDTITSVDWPVAKLIWGDEGTATYASASNPLPVTVSGVATAANQTAANGILTTIDADTGNIATAAASIDSKTPALGQALAAASVPVVLTAAQLSTLTPPAAITGFATESTLGTLSAKFASGTVIGDVNLGATDNAVLDAIAASVAAIDAGQLADGHNVTVSGSVTANIGTVGTLATAAKQDTGNTSLATLAGAVAGTEVQVDIVTMPNVTIAGTVTVGSHAVTNAGTFAVQVDGAALTSLQLLDDSVATTGSAITSKGMAAVGTDGTNARILKTDAAGELQVDVLTLPSITGTVTANAGTNLNTSALALESGGNLAAISGTTYVNNGALSRFVGMGAWDANDTGTMKALTCDVNGILFVANQGGFAVQAEQSGTWNVATVTTLTGGGVAHDSADSGNPVKTGARAAGTLSNDTMVADADRADNVADLDGCLMVRSGFPLGDLISERVTDTSGTSTAFSNFGATASARNYVTSIVVYNSSATAGTIDFRDGTGGSVLYTVPIPATGGAVICNGGVPLFRTTANTALAYDVSGALTTVTISLSGFKSKV